MVYANQKGGAVWFNWLGHRSGTQAGLCSGPSSAMDLLRDLEQVCVSVVELVYTTSYCAVSQGVNLQCTRLSCSDILSGCCYNAVTVPEDAFKKW